MNAILDFYMAESIFFHSLTNDRDMFELKFIKDINDFNFRTNERGERRIICNNKIIYYNGELYFFLLNLIESFQLTNPFQGQQDHQT